MAARQQKPRSGIVAVASSSLLVALCFAGTAIAAHNSTIVEITGHDNDDLSADELLSSDELRNRAAKAATDTAAFEKSSPPAEAGKTPAAQIVVKQPDPAQSKLPDVRARIPGISDNGLARFKRQMYRRDI